MYVKKGKRQRKGIETSSREFIFSPQDHREPHCEGDFVCGGHCPVVWRFSTCRDGHSTRSAAESPRGTSVALCLAA